MWNRGACFHYFTEQAMMAECREREMEEYEESSLCAAAVESLSDNHDVVCPICRK